MLRTRHPGSAGRSVVEIIGIVMISSIVLCLFQQVEDLTH